ncbi:MAG: lamin tail domain-containing protein [Bacteroidota bacterium]
MKKIVYILIFFLGLTSCLEDKDLIEPQDPIGGEASVVINEVMSNNVGDGVDWIEIYNGGSEAVDLGGYKLNDAENPENGWAIPAGTTVEAGGYIVFDEDTWDFGGVSSSGEWVSFADAAGTLIDKIYVPSMSADAGLTYAREVDGGEVWIISSPTENAMNGDVENLAPILDASDLTEFDDVYSVNASDADGISSVKLVFMDDDGIATLDMALVDGKYRTSVPKALVGSVVKYYVIAADNTGLKTVYPEGGIETPGEYTVVGGFEELTLSEILPDPAINSYDFSFTAMVYYADQVDEVRLYYLLPGETQDEANGFDDKHSIKNVPEINDGIYKATINGLTKDTELRYYLRVEYIDGTKTYYPMETSDVDGNVTSDFNHDLGTTWPIVTVGSIPEIPVNGFSELSIVNETGADLTYDIKVENDNGLSEIRLYYYINFDEAAFTADPTGYEDANRNKITWEGALPTADNMYNFAIPTAGLTAGDKISWYMRARDNTADETKFYYTFGKTAEEFDGDIKDDPTTWHVITKN